MKKNDLPVFSSLIQGKNQISKDPSGDWVVITPARTDHAIGVCQYSYAQIDQVTKAATQGRISWIEKSYSERKKILARAFEALLTHKEKWTQVAQEELSRTHFDVDCEWSALDRWYRGFSAFDPAALENPGEPRGVTAVLGSYVWPLYHSVSFSFLNLLAGNAVVLKPSEKATLSVLKMAEIFTQDSELAEVIHVLIGEKEMGRRLICHEQVQTVIFMGSYEVGLRVKQDTLSQTSKQVLLYLGSKNPTILCEDYPANAMNALIQDCFLSTGQHCRSASMILVHRSRFRSFCESFHGEAKKFKIGSPLSGAYMGALIDPAMQDRYLKYAGISEREGAEVMMRGKPLSLEEKGNFVTPTIAVFESLTGDQMKKSVSLQTEILAPHISIIPFNDDEALKEITDPIQHGLCASIWGEDRDHLKKVSRLIEVGQVQFNQSLLEWDPIASFQAFKKSGNQAYHGFKLWEQLTSLRSTGKICIFSNTDKH